MVATHQPWTHRDTLAQAVETYHTDIKVARHFGTDSETIRRWRITHDLPVHVRGWTPRQIEYVRKYASTVTNRRMAKRTGKSVGSITYMARHLGERFHEYRQESVTSADIADELGVSDATVRYMVTRHGMPSTPVKCNGRHGYHTFDYDAVESWLREGHILRFNRERLGLHFRTIYDTIRPAWVDNEDLKAIDPWLGEPSFHLHRKRGPRPVPFIIGQKTNHTAYYRWTDVYAHYYRYGDCIPLNIKAPWLVAIREAWESCHIMAVDLYDYLPRSTIDHYRRTRGFPYVLYRTHYIRPDVVEWCEANGHEVLADKIRRKPVCYLEAVQDVLSTKRYGIHAWMGVSW